MLNNIAMSSTSDEAGELLTLPASGGDHFSSLATRIQVSVQGFDASKRATNDTQTLVNVGLQTVKQMGLITISLTQMFELLAKFVQEAYFLGASILNVLIKLKQLTGPKKSYFGESLAQMEDFIFRQHARVGKTSQKASSTTGKRATKAKKAEGFHKTR